MNRPELEQFGEDVLQLFTSHNITLQRYSMDIELKVEYFQSIESSFMMTKSDWSRLFARSDTGLDLSSALDNAQEVIIPAVFGKLWYIALSPFCFPTDHVDIAEPSNLRNENNQEITEQLVIRLGDDIWRRLVENSVDLCRYHVTIDISQANYLAWKDQFTTLLPPSRPNGFVVKRKFWEMIFMVRENVVTPSFPPQ